MKRKEKPKEHKARIERARIINDELAKLFPDPKTVLIYGNSWELLVAVILSAQCTDKMVNKVTEKLFQKYRTVKDYANAPQEVFEQDIRSTGFYRSKAKNIIATAQKVVNEYGGEVPRTMTELTSLSGVARKTANVVLGNAFGIVEGIAVDTHVKRLSNKFLLSDEHDPVKIEKDLMELLPKSEWFVFTYRLINYGRTHSPAKKVESFEDPISILLKSNNLL